MTRTDDPTTTSTTGSDAVFRLETLGVARLIGPEGDVLLGPGLPLALLTYLHGAPGRAARRERLADTFWGASPTPRGRQSLRQTLLRLRRELGDAALGDRDGTLSLQLPLTSDRDDFMNAVRSGHYGDALRIYRGDFFPDFSSPGSADFEAWVHAERMRLRDLFSRAAEFEIRHALDRGETRSALDLARRLREELPESELAWRLLLEALLSAGDAVAVRLEADTLERLLAADGRRLEPATRDLIHLARSELRQPAEPGQPELVAQLTGREREFRRLLQAWQAAASGRPDHVHVSAPAGLGKTRLLDEFRVRLELHGVQVVALRASPGDREVEYAVLGELASLLVGLPGAPAIAPAHAAVLLAFRPELEDRFPGVRPAPSPAHDDVLLLRANMVRALLHAVADERPTALLVDDLHWMDAPSRRALELVAGHLGQTPLLIVTAGRPDPVRLAGLPAARVIHLQPLTSSQIEALLESLASFPNAETAAAAGLAVDEGSDGSPLLVLEAIRSATEQGHLAIRDGEWLSPNWGMTLGALRWAGTLHARLESLTPAQRHVLTILALAGVGLTMDEIARVSGLEDVEEILTGLERRAHVTLGGGAWSTAHEKVDESVQASAGPDLVRSCHLGLGRLFTAEAEPQDGRFLRGARHLAAAGETDEVARLFAHWVDALREDDDRRGASALASEFLGSASAIDPAVLVGRLPYRDRFWPDLRRGLVAATAIIAVAGILGVGLNALAPDPRTPDAVLLIPVRRSADEFMLHHVEVHANRLGAADTLRPEDGKAWGRWKGARGLYGGSAVMSPDGRRIAYTRSVSDSGIVDIFLRDADGTTRRLTDAPLDDIDPSWSPDGRFLVLASARWSPPGDHDFSLAVLEVETGETRRLTTLAGVDDRTPVWSPDGTRIAFRRTDALVHEWICWITFDGSVERCHPVGQGTEAFVVGWRGGDRIVREARSGDAILLLDMDPDTGTEVWLDSLPVGARTFLDPDGRWALCVCGAGGGSDGRYLFRIGDPTRTRYPIHTPDYTGIPIWVPSGPGSTVPHLRLEPPGAVTTGTSHLLQAAAVRGDGSRRDLPQAVLSWSVSDPGIATVERASGLLFPRRDGKTWVHVSAGGWLHDSVLIRVSDPAVTLLQREDWGPGWLDRWTLFGDPLPRVVDEEGTQAFWNHGDETFESGALSRSAHGAANGLGLEALVRTPVTRTLWQRLTLGIASGAQPAENGLVGRVGCTFRVPASEGVRAASVYAMTMGAALTEEPIPDWMRARWYRVRLQLFPDGTCGVAVDGIPIWRSEERLPLVGLYAVHSYGQSVGTRMLVGPMEMWAGVRTDVDWSVLDSAVIRRVAERK